VESSSASGFGGLPSLPPVAAFIIIAAVEVFPLHLGPHALG
jgi:hypothetical protein